MENLGILTDTCVLLSALGLNRFPNSSPDLLFYLSNGHRIPTIVTPMIYKNAPIVLQRRYEKNGESPEQQKLRWFLDRSEVISIPQRWSDENVPDIEAEYRRLREESRRLIRDYFVRARRELMTSEDLQTAERKLNRSVSPEDLEIIVTSVYAKEHEYRRVIVASQDTDLVARRSGDRFYDTTIPDGLHNAFGVDFMWPDQVLEAIKVSS